MGILQWFRGLFSADATRLAALLRVTKQLHGRLPHVFDVNGAPLCSEIAEIEQRPQKAGEIHRFETRDKSGKVWRWYVSANICLARDHKRHELMQYATIGEATWLDTQANALWSVLQELEPSSDLITAAKRAFMELSNGIDAAVKGEAELLTAKLTIAKEAAVKELSKLNAVLKAKGIDGKMHFAPNTLPAILSVFLSDLQQRKIGFADKFGAQARLCALFINYEDEDTTDASDAMIERKLMIWDEAHLFDNRFNRDFFLRLCIAQCQDYKQILPAI